VHAVATFRGFSAAGEELRSVDNRLTWVLRSRPDGSWRIVHEHTSVPIALETSRPVPRA
jgi:ketosteroid isomerase-like protein